MKKKNRDKRLKILFLFFLVALIGLLVFNYSLSQEDDDRLNPITNIGNKPEKPREPEYFCPLCGKKVSEESITKRRPILVKVENSPEARPQSGLDKACVVYEMLAEGGITRFAAIFNCTEADSIGPIRSARFPDAILAPQYDAFFAHCGGTIYVLKEIRAAGVADLDEMRYGKKGYWRIKSRKMPHNLYSSTKSLRDLALEEGFEDSISYEGFNFKNEEVTTSPLTDISISYNNWNKVVYKYDKETNSHLRFHRTTAHNDSYTGEQIRAKNVVIMYAEKIVTGYLEDRYGSKSLKFGLTGEGEAFFYLDGKEIKGKWSANNSSPPTFFDEAGEVFEFNSGNIWIEIVPLNTKIDVVKSAPETTGTTGSGPEQEIF